jgi:hypothetical protein
LDESEIEFGAIEVNLLFSTKTHPLTGNQSTDNNQPITD